MRGQKGQSVVEFALVIPLFLLLVIGMIYGGFAYADYLQYGNAVRDAARDIAAMQDTTQRTAIINGLKSNSPGTVNRYAKPLTPLYKATFSVDDGEAGYVTVAVSLSLDADVNLLPESLKNLQCTMPMERELYSGDDPAGNE